MTKSQYPYAPDEFDVPAPEGAPVGVHRTPRSRWSKTWPFLVVAVVFAGLALGGVSLLSRGDSPPPVAETPTSQEPTEPTDGEDADGAGDEGAGDVDGETEGSEEGAETEGSEEGAEEGTEDESTDEPTGDVDLTLGVRVLNGAGVDGLAGAGSDVLTEAGFTSVEAVTYEGEALPASAVWYQGAENEDTAREIARLLGISAVEEVSPLRAPVAVIFMTDFRS
ncbi:LytR C-terminal domain-containing protein [Oerskovia flava]|uniref:LytR C-terminal domain-containing protein n=1 Tax=Oerskovia flava TaxID=2986422 RepID=UPI002240C08A|nr:LytR C-terminal domain-containing protein [Oerskovia sp. JB1-3-2]